MSSTASWSRSAATAAQTSTWSAGGCSTGDEKIPLAYLIFDVLALRGRSLLDQSYRQRRARLAACDFRRVAHAPDAFDDGDALWEAVCEQRLEGVVAKRLDERYRPGERRRVKRKNRGWARYERERETAIESALRRQRQLV